MPNVMCITPGFKLGLQNKGHDIPLAIPVIQCFEHHTSKQEYPTAAKNYYNIFLQLCIPLFHFSVSWFSVMQFGVIHLETWGSTQPYVAFSTPVLVSLFLATHTRH
jgi:hypothetical protein